MKCETFTYSAHVTDYSVRASAPSRMGRLPASLEVADSPAQMSAPVSALCLQLWIWMQLQIATCLTIVPLPRIVCSQPKHIFVLPTVEGEDEAEAPRRALRVNRAMSRRLARIARLRPEAFSDWSGAPPDWVRALPVGQYLDYMIRVHKWNRVRVFGLSTRGRRANRGGVLSLGQPANCNAILMPE